MQPLRELNGPASPSLDLQPVHFRVERFEYAPSELVLRLSLRVSHELQRTCPMLFIEREGLEHAYTPLVSCTAGAAQADREESLWRGAFAVPLDLASAPRGSFVLSLRDDLLLALPEPDVRTLGQVGGRRERSGPAWPYAVRRAALLLVVTCQLSLGIAFSPTLSHASAGAATQAEATPETPPQPPSQGPGEPGPQAPPEQPPGGPGQPPPEAPEPPPTGEPTQSAGEALPTPAPGAPSGPPVDTPAAAPSPAQANAGASSAAGVAQGLGDASPSTADVRSQTPRRASPTRRSHSVGSPQHLAGKDHRQAEPGRDSRPAPPAPVLASSPALDPAEVPTFPAGLPPGLLGGFEEGPPAYLIPIYVQAAHRYHVPWRVLAAINGIETDYGRNLAVSPAGAVGWMQFMPDTWRQWAVDGDHDGHLNPYSPQDAIFSAARYLHASGASRDLRAAIFAYNHADWYVTEVLLRARMIGNVASFARVEKGYSLPLDARYMQQLGRTDDGVDLESAPDGALVYSITPGIVSAVASDPGGFGPDYPVIEATSGSLAGAHIYYGHVAAALVQPGQPVHAGQPIAIVGHTGDAASLGHGHIEIGFSEAGGDPLSHHGAEAWTPAGSVMRSFLGSLSSDFAVHSTQ
jgi:murein DD-endopeptidase MepM/ murein hydrolase activator NlpD